LIVWLAIWAGVFPPAAAESTADVFVTPAETKVDPAIPDAVWRHFEDTGNRPLRSFSIDLNGDSIPEKLVLNEYLCGNGGCPWAILDVHRETVIGDLFAKRILIQAKRQNGYRLIVCESSAGQAVSIRQTYEFRDGRYRKAEPRARRATGMQQGLPSGVLRREDIGHDPGNWP
jgi:hypothetical protein